MAAHHYIQWNAAEKQFICQGEWNIANLNQLKKVLKKISWPAIDTVIMNGKSITKLDSAGAWLINQWTKNLSKKNIRVQFQYFSEQHEKLLSFAEKQTVSRKDIPKIKMLGWVAQLGKYSIDLSKEFYEYLSFIGKLSLESFRVLYHPALWRWRTVTDVINKTGTQALPIIALLSFMIGIVISYQMGNQLRNYGANVFIVNLLGLSILREFGPLLTAIMVSGRTGSAFTAQIGMMKINQEIDALNTMGVTPDELLLLPRLVALLIVLPLLTIWADIFGILGGMIMANTILSVPPLDFLQRFQQVIPLRALLIGLGKAPLFALVIASIGCFQGMAVHGSAESVGARTTRSVVLAIFFIILIDAGISVLLSEYKL